MDIGKLQTFRVAACDLNGQMRGKVVPGSYAEKLDSGAVRMPLSVLNLDLWGEDIDGSPLVFETGDAGRRFAPDRTHANGNPVAGCALCLGADVHVHR